MENTRPEADKLPAATARLLADETLPLPVRQFLAAGGQLEQIVLDEQGLWSHQGEPFQNPALIALFSRSLVRTPGGTWLVHIPPFSYPVEVRDTPYYVRSARYADDQVFLHLSDDSEERLDPATLRYVEGRGLYCRVKARGGPRERADDGSSERPDDGSTERPGDGSGDGSGERPGERPDDGSSERAGERPGERAGDGLAERVGSAARLLRPAYFALSNQISEEPGGFFFTLAGQRSQVPEVSWQEARAH